jgi:hypothetical protein
MTVLILLACEYDQRDCLVVSSMIPSVVVIDSENISAEFNLYMYMEEKTGNHD